MMIPVAECEAALFWLLALDTKIALVLWLGTLVMLWLEYDFDYRFPPKDDCHE